MICPTCGQAVAPKQAYLRITAEELASLAITYSFTDADGIVHHEHVSLEDAGTMIGELLSQFFKPPIPFSSRPYPFLQSGKWISRHERREGPSTTEDDDDDECDTPLHVPQSDA